MIVYVLEGTSHDTVPLLSLRGRTTESKGRPIVSRLVSGYVLYCKSGCSYTSHVCVYIQEVYILSCCRQPPLIFIVLHWLGY